MQHRKSSVTKVMSLRLDAKTHRRLHAYGVSKLSLIHI